MKEKLNPGWVVYYGPAGGHLCFTLDKEAAGKLTVCGQLTDGKRLASDQRTMFHRCSDCMRIMERAVISMITAKAGGSQDG